jgi:O-antigen/teichoic acid export membrane protein
MKETSRFYSSLSLLILLNAIIKPIWIFAIDRQVQNEVGIAAYGAYFSIFNLCIVFSFLLDLGLTNFYNRQLSARDESVSDKAGSFIYIKLLLALLYAFVISFIIVVSGIKRWDIVLYVMLTMILTSLFVFLRSIVTSHQWFQTDAWLSVLDKLLMIFLCGTFLYFPSLLGRISIERFLVLQLCCTAVATLITFIIILVRKFHFRFKKLWPGAQVFKAAFPYAIIVLLMAFHSRIDGFLLERISGAEEAGKYAGAYRLLDAANMIGFLFASFLLPYITRHWTEKKNITNVVLNIRHLLLVFSLTVSCVGIFLGPWIQQVLYHHEDGASIQVLQWCLPAVVGYSLVHVYGTVLTATGYITSFAYITAISIVINLCINIILIPSLGAKASCIAALSSQFFCGIGAMFFVKQKLQIDIDSNSLLKYIFIAGLIAGVLYLCQDLPISKWWIIAGTGVLVLVMLWIARLVDLDNWRKAIRQ